MPKGTLSKAQAETILALAADVVNLAAQSPQDGRYPDLNPNDVARLRHDHMTRLTAAQDSLRQYLASLTRTAAKQEAESV